MIPCPYPECLAFLAERDEAQAWHYRAAHRRKPVVHNHDPHQMDRIERCKLCPPPGFPLSFYANGCKHIDLGLQMLQHAALYHADQVIGLNIERQRLARSLEGRQN